ncbi:MAG: 2-keto-4-pentenoate hydratase [Acidimicrobiia bacterium]|nr:MAG: 2-keto-4-pentenoate hydratase [Acidimicrobiia bacterium]
MDAAELAARLFRARREVRPVAPLTDEFPSMSVGEAYAVQRELVSLLLGEGGRVVGFKLGLTSRPMQEMFGVDEPDYGPVLSSMVFDDGACLSVSGLIQPRVEAEVALVLSRPLEGPGVTAVEAASAVGGAVAALEVVDSRIEGWRIRLADTIADLASSAATVLGSRVVGLAGWDPRLCGMVIYRNGEVMATGAGAAALGGPLRAVAWLANTLAGLGERLEAGWFVMTGSLHGAFGVSAGDVVRAEFDRLGGVTVRFV